MRRPSQLLCLALPLPTPMRRSDRAVGRREHEVLWVAVQDRAMGSCTQSAVNFTADVSLSLVARPKSEMLSKGQSSKSVLGYRTEVIRSKSEVLWSANVVIAKPLKVWSVAEIGVTPRVYGLHGRGRVYDLQVAHGSRAPFHSFLVTSTHVAMTGGQFHPATMCVCVILSDQIQKKPPKNPYKTYLCRLQLQGLLWLQG